MNSINLRQISELSDNEKRKFQTWINHYLGRLYAAQQRRKRIMSERTKIEYEIESEVQNGI